MSEQTLLLTATAVSQSGEGAHPSFESELRRLSGIAFFRRAHELERRLSLLDSHDVKPKEASLNTKSPEIVDDGLLEDSDVLPQAPASVALASPPQTDSPPSTDGPTRKRRRVLANNEVHTSEENSEQQHHVEECEAASLPPPSLGVSVDSAGCGVLHLPHPSDVQFHRLCPQNAKNDCSNVVEPAAANCDSNAQASGSYSVADPASAHALIQNSFAHGFTEDQIGHCLEGPHGVLTSLSAESAFPLSATSRYLEELLLAGGASLSPPCAPDVLELIRSLLETSEVLRSAHRRRSATRDDMNTRPVQLVLCELAEESLSHLLVLASGCRPEASHSGQELSESRQKARQRLLDAVSGHAALTVAILQKPALALGPGISSTVFEFVRAFHEGRMRAAADSRPL